MRKIAVSIFKGGTGKSSVAVHVAVGLARRGRRVVLVDLDAQASASRMLGANGEAPTIREVLVDRVDPGEAVRTVEAGPDLLAASRTLAPIESWLTGQMRREEILKRRLDSLDGYDYVILDCAPAWSLLNLNALVYAEELWLPVSMDFLSLVGVQQLEETLATIRDELEHEIGTRRVIPNFYDRRTRKSRDVLEALDDAFPESLTPPIRRNVSISEAPSFGETVFDYAPSSIGAKDFEALVEHLDGDGA